MPDFLASVEPSGRRVLMESLAKTRQSYASTLALGLRETGGPRILDPPYRVTMGKLSALAGVFGRLRFSATNSS
jgi:hypothetical protein